MQRRALPHDVERLVDGAFGHGQRMGVHLGDLIRQRARLCIQIGAWHDPVHHAASFRLMRVDGSRGEQHFLRLARAQFPCVPMIFNAADAHQHDGVGKTRIVRRDDQVAWPGEQQSARYACALHRRDRRFGNVAPAPGIAQIMFRFPFMDAQQSTIGNSAANAIERSFADRFFTDVMASRKMLALRPQQDDAHRFILCRAFPGRIQLRKKWFVLGVGPVGAVQRDRGDPVIDLVTDKICHGTYLLPCRLRAIAETDSPYPRRSAWSEAPRTKIDRAGCRMAMLIVANKVEMR